MQGTWVDSVASTTRADEKRKSIMEFWMVLCYDVVFDSDMEIEDVAPTPTAGSRDI
jgi:hypothetical protein